MNSILIANRGEIALRIARAARDLGFRVIAVYSENDRDQPFVKQAHEAWSLGGGPLSETYLNAERILEVALATDSWGIHPGYGFLSENPAFATLCGKYKIAFIGPAPETIALMGDKVAARKKASELGLPVLEGRHASPGELMKSKEELPYPILVKAAAGGGGRGMRLVESAASLEEALEGASREAQNSFGSGQVYVEQYLEGARHIEVQVLADHHGKVNHLFDRECSLQRRYQKIMEEAPSPALSPASRENILMDALKLARGVDYRNAGTVEFLVDQEGQHYFLEMNTRIQVEHAPTEMITGIDLVKEQIRMAQGHALEWEQQDISIRGHAIEIRLYAEDPAAGFLPGSGRIRHWDWPEGPGLRLETDLEKGLEVGSEFDPLLAKLIAHGKDREEAHSRLLAALDSTVVTGLPTNRQFLIALLQNAAVAAWQVHTSFVDEQREQLLDQIREEEDSIPLRHILSAAMLRLWMRPGPWRALPSSLLIYKGAQHRIIASRKSENSWDFSSGKESWKVDMLSGDEQNSHARVDGKNIRFKAYREDHALLLHMNGHLLQVDTLAPLRKKRANTGFAQEEIGKTVVAPLNGRLTALHVKTSDRVSEGQTLAVIESMKMENQVLAPGKGIVREVHLKENEQIQKNQAILTIDYD